MSQGKDKWHRNSRYWQIGPWIVLLSVAVAFWFDDPTPFNLVAPVFLGGAGGANFAERWRPQPLYPDDERI